MKMTLNDNYLTMMTIIIKANESNHIKFTNLLVKEIIINDNNIYAKAN